MPRFITFLIALIAVIALIGVAGCSPAPISRSESPRDPTGAAAPEGVDPTVATGVGTAPASSAAPPATAPAATGHDHSHGAVPSKGDTQAATYTCPMHPEVTSDRPGVCPKCNMTLVPKK